MEKSPSVFYQVVAILFVCGIGCYGNDEPIQHLILLDDLPVSLDRTSPLVLDIRSDYKGIVEFQESDKFQVLLNVTAPSVGEAYMVHHEVVKHQDGLLIQVYKSHPSPWIPHITLYKIMAAILVLVALVLLLCLLVALWWYKSRRASENIWKDRGLDDSAQQQPLMYRSRNSMQLATQSGDMLLGEREGETTHEDVLHHVPEIPEDDESEIPMEHLKHSPKKQISLREGFSSDEDDLRKRRGSSKDRFESPSKKGHQDLSRIRKRAKGYKEDSFDMSDQSSDWSHQDEPERTNQNSCEIKYEAHRKKMTTFCPEMEQSPVQKSDGAIVYNTSSLRRYENMDCLPTSVPGQISAIQEKRGYVSNAGDSKSAEEKIIEDNIRNEKRGAPVPGGFVRAFDNRIYESSPPPVGQKLVPKGEYIYVNDVPPSYASHSDYPVHSDRPAPSNRLLPGLNQKVSYPPSPSMSNKDGSYCSDSGRSASIADSSDVFEENTSHAMFHDTDSEVEIPPLDLDDFPSSYMPESLRLQQKLAESPEKKPKKPSLMVIPRVVSKDPSPQNTPKLVTFQQPNATSPEHSAPERGYKTLPASVPDHGFIKQPLTTSTIDTRSNSKPESQNTGKTSGTGNTGSLQALRNIHVAMVCSLCVLGLASGVYAQLLSETEVRILVLSPPGFLSNRSAVYLNKNRWSEVRAENIRSTVLWYEVPSARLVDVNSTQCRNNLCSQGCDANTGKCLCLRGFALSGDYDCIDVDECYEGSAKCSPYASCQDTQGSYRCICGNSYYGDGISCKACSTPCREGSFQVQPCIPDSKQQKICKVCTTQCHEGFYMYRKCNPQNDAICRMCQPRCESDQYEHTVCYGNQTRQCREKKWMPPPETSDNVLLEDLTEVKSHTFRIREDQDFDLQQDNVFRINRGSNLTVTIKIKELRISPQFRPVDFKHQSGKDGFLGLPKITSDYCPQPLPRYYKLSSRLYKDVYYKIGQTCSHGNCRSEPKPCKTFRSYGYYPNLRRRYGEFTLVCTESGPLAHLFGLNQQLTAATSSRAEVSDSCSSRLSACDDCTRGCARQVSQAKGDCEVRGDNGDNGWSPRLQSCYSCCVEPRCMEVCRNYTLSGCSPEMCRKGSLVEFKLEAVYARAASEFYCSVQPIKNQLLVSFEYSVQHRGQQLNKKSVSIFADEEWMNNGQMTKRDGFIDFTVASHVTRQPDVIAGDITTPAYWAGRYRGDGDALRQTGQETVYLHPRKPFLITPSEWKRSICSDDIVAKAFKAVKRDIPYKKMRDFRVNVEGRRVFSIANQTRAPELELHMGRYMSVLAAIYPRAEVSYETLTGSITHDNSQWVISIEGHVKRFPGVLSVNVSDTNYKETPLFMYDILVRRQRAFRLISRLPTGDHVTIGRDFTVSVRDANQTIHLMLHRPHTPIVENYETAAKNQAEPVEEDARRSEKEASAEALDETEDSLSTFPFSVPFIAAACGAIVLLLFMAGFGIFITPGDPSTDETSHFQPRHLLFAVMYFTFQVAYCLVVSLTTFVLVWVALNSESVSFIQQYGHQTALQKALNSLELARMQSHLVAEMRRQSDAANQTKSTCDLEIRRLVNEVEEEKKALSLSVTPDLWREMKDRISKHTQTVLEDFSQQLTRARENYNYYANYLMEKLVFDIQQSYVSLVSSRWLDGAKFLHGTVRNVRTLLNRQDTRPFMEWMGLESSFSQFAVGIDLSMPLPPLPSVEDFTPGSDRYQPSTPEPMTSSFVAVPPVVHVYNLWFNGDSEDMAPVYRTVERNNSSGSKPSDRGLSSRSELLIFVAVMVLIDVMWLIHRAVKAYRVSRLILCGYPLYVDCSENKGETSSERAQHCPLVTCCVTKKQSATRRLLTKTLSSLFIPKLVAMAMVCLFVYVTMTISTVLVRKETLASIGYYNDLENLLSLNKKLINGRLSANAERINTVEYPVYQDLLNMYVQRHLVLLEMTRQQHAADNISAAENGLPPFVNNINCRFPKLQPKLYQRVGNTEDMLIGRHADPLLQAVRKLVTDSCFLILLYLAVVAIKQLLNMVIWLYVKRAGLVHLWIIYETNADEIRVQER